MTNSILIWLAAGALAIAHFAAIAVYALRDFSRGQLRELLRVRGTLPQYDEIIEQHQPAAIAAEHFRVAFTAIATIAAVLYTLGVEAGSTSWTQSIGISIAYGFAGILLLWLTIIWIPSAAARIWSESFLAATWPVWRAASKFTSVLGLFANLVERGLQLVSGKPRQQLTEEQLEEEIREVVTEGQREGLLEDDAREMIESVIALGEISVSEIMTPRTDMFSLPADISWDDAIQKVVASGHTRIPVTGSSRDEIVGILHIKDLFQEQARAAKANRRSIRQILRPPFFIPESKPVDGLLQEFQRTHNHIAVVLDEYGGVSGLATIEDVLEEIVGEIADEHDDFSGDGVRLIDEKTCEAFARVHIHEINEKLHLFLPETEHYDTIGGFLFHHLGRIPHTGEEILYEGVKFKVLEATRRRVNRVLIEVLPPAEENAPPEDEKSSDAKVHSAE